MLCLPRFGTHANTQNLPHFRAFPAGVQEHSPPKCLFFMANERFLPSYRGGIPHPCERCNLCPHTTETATTAETAKAVKTVAVAFSTVFCRTTKGRERRCFGTTKPVKTAKTVMKDTPPPLKFKPPFSDILRSVGFDPFDWGPPHLPGEFAFQGRCACLGRSPPRPQSSRHFNNPLESETMRPVSRLKAGVSPG